ncbi:GntR family transcriptional repressor for pyruvate dehydrogenase complex [Arthrobacter sp. MW3 TE3886]
MEFSLSADPTIAEPAPRATRRKRAAPSVAGLKPVTVVHAEPASSEVAKALLDYIFSGQVAPGEKLPSERQLSESFGVGRSVVREGIKSLGLLGLVEFRHGGGTFLRDTNSELLPRVIEWGLMLGERRTSDLVEARQHIERVTAGLAASRRTDADLKRIKTALDAMGVAKTTEEFVAADVDFHLAVADASGNTVLANMLKNIAALLRVWIHRVMDAETSFTGSHGEHTPVYEAILAGDAEKASGSMAKHMDAASGRLMATLQSEE